ncbi:MAG: chromosome partitioning protein ParB [Anaerolineae bacterium]|nr:chromosome partitioning protein ParB [Anaerolineae bacterium]
MNTQENTGAEKVVTPLTDWKNAPSLRELKQDYSDAKPVHDAQVKKIEEWLDNLNTTGKAKPPLIKGRSSIAPKLIRKQAEWRYPALSEPFLSTEDLFNVSPVTWEDRHSAQQNQLVLNNQINTKIDKVSFIDEYVRTAVDEGTVAVRVGWEFEEEEIEEMVPEIEFFVNPSLAPMHQQIAQIKEENPAQYEAEVPEEMKQAHELTVERGIPIEARVLRYVPQKVMRTVRNQPTLEVCDYRNLVIDPTCKGDLDKATFAVYSFETSVAELKRDGKYKNLDAINLNTNSILGEPDHATDGYSNFNFVDKLRMKIVAHEYWGYWDIHKTGKLVPIVATWVGDVLVRMEENPFPDKKIPFVIAQYLPKRRSIYGEPDGELLEDNQKIIGAVTRGMIDIMGRSANGQTGMRKDMLDATNKRKFERGLDYEFNANIDPRQGVYMHTFPEIPASAQFMLQMQNLEAESLTGVKAFSQGIGSQSLGDVAAGIRGALDAASKRELGLLRRLSEGVIKIGRKMISMNQEFLSKEEVVRITNEKFVKVRRDDLSGNFDLKLSISTAEEDNNKAEQLAFMLQTMGNNMDPEMMRMILSDIARLRKMPELAHKIENYQPQPDPMMQKKMELEVALLEAQVENERAQTQQYLTAAQLNMARAGLEGARAGNVQSDTDQKNLDFIEQESGVKQERDLQKQGEQARSQMGLKLLDIESKKQLAKAKST